MPINWEVVEYITVQLGSGVLCNTLCSDLKALKDKLNEKTKAQKSVLCHCSCQKEGEDVYTYLLVYPFFFLFFFYLYILNLFLERCPRNC